MDSLSLIGSSAAQSRNKKQTTSIVADCSPPMQATIELLSEFDAELAASVRGVANLRTKEYKQQLAAEGYPADFTRRSYMRYQIKKLLVTDVEWQFEALSQVHWPAELV